MLGGAVFDDGLGDGGDVVVVEAGGEGAAAMAGGAEGNALGGEGGIGVQGVVGGDEAGDVDEVFGEWRLAGLVWRLECGWAAHALFLVSDVGDCHYMGCELPGEILWESDQGRGDTEVAVKDACVLGLVSLKREYSQLFVLFCIIASRIRDYTGDVHSRVSIVDWMEAVPGARSFA